MRRIPGRRRRVTGPAGPLELSQSVSRHLWLSMVGCLAIALLMSSASRASLAPPPPAPLAAPVIQGCTYIPNPRTNTSLICGDSSLSAFVNVSVFFQVNVSDSTDTNMSVTFFFDYINGNGSVNANSPERTINVSSPGTGVTVSVNTTWTYATPNANFSQGQYWMNINVSNNAAEFTETGPFPVVVATNSPPYMSGLLSLNSVSQSIRPQNPVIPLVYENVSVGDSDSDSVTVTWDWGDGTQTVNITGALLAPLAMSVTHQYAASVFPLNQTPRYFDIPVVVWIDDGLGHNASLNSTTEFYLDFDSPPTVRIERPTVGSIWKVGEPVAMVGNVTDPEGSPITAYWDFDNRTDSTGIGDPKRNQDASGTTATHNYTAPGVYNITLWATDGNKELCLNQTTCANFTTHWTAAVQPIEVRYNIPPHLALDNASIVLGHPLVLEASVLDYDGDSMAVRWVFGDGTPDGANVTGITSRVVPQSVRVYQEHNYTEAGIYNLTVYVSDGNASVNKTVTVVVESFNLPPVLLKILVFNENGTSSTNNSFPVNATVVIQVLTYDPENDTLNVSLSWGNGESDNLTVDPKTASGCALDNLSRRICTLSFSHVYADIGSNLERNYTVIASVTDNQLYFRTNATGGPPITLNHEKHQTVPITITNYRSEGATPWGWWDYSTLAVVLAVPSILLGRFAWKVRRERQEA